MSLINQNLYICPIIPTACAAIKSMELKIFNKAIFATDLSLLGQDSVLQLACKILYKGLKGH